jgi:DNA (cytosine-5)-methyltransferase 1
MLEKNVDEKYYLPDERIDKILNSTFVQEKKRIQTKDVCDTLLARDWKDPKCVQIEEPFIVASRGRNPDDPSDRTTGAPTKQRLEPNFSGCTNTLTSVQKDNWVAEPIVCEERRDEGIRLFKDDCVGTLRTIDACGDKRVLEPEPKLVGGIGEKNFGKQYRQGNRVYDSEAIAMALNAQPVGNAGGYSYLYTVAEPNNIKWRIRKLTPKECWRLMGFTDEDHDRASKYVSASALYKQAGNSICTCCLVAIFNALFLEDYSTSYAEKLVDYNS